MATARNIIEGAMKILGAIASGESASASEISEGLDTLNELIESLSTESLIIQAITKETFTCTPNRQVHTLGPGGDFDTDRPIDIKRIIYQDPANAGFELPIKIRQFAEYAEFVDKLVDSTIPYEVYIETGYPLMNLYFWPVPSNASKAVIWSEKIIQSFASASTDVSLPPGYLRMLKYNLAMELAPEFGLSMTPEAMEIAMSSKGNVKRKNKRPRFLKSDAVSVRARKPYDWRTGE